MDIIHTQGVVLRSTNIKESDRMLTIFSPELGKLSVLSRGCRKPKSRLLSMSQLFCYGDLILQPYRDILILQEAEVKNAYFDIRKDLERLSYATYILNLTEDIINTGEGNLPVFTLLLHGLTYLSYSDMKAEDITLVYELKLLDMIGYRPEVDCCMICGAKPVNNIRFSSADGGILCERCHDNGISGSIIHMETLQAMRYVLDIDMSQIKLLKFLPEVREQLNKILPEYIEQKLDKKFKSRDFLNSFFTPIP